MSTLNKVILCSNLQFFGHTVNQEVLAHISFWHANTKCQTIYNCHQFISYTTTEDIHQIHQLRLSIANRRQHNHLYMAYSTQHRWSDLSHFRNCPVERVQSSPPSFQTPLPSGQGSLLFYHPQITALKVTNHLGHSSIPQMVTFLLTIT